MNSALYPGLSVTPTDIYEHPGPQDAPWEFKWRRLIFIKTNSGVETRFAVEGTVMPLVVPGVSYEKDVLRPGTKRVLRDWNSWAELAADQIAHGKSFP